MLMVSFDWIEMLSWLADGLGFMRLGKASRALRIVRMVRLLRLVRMQSILQSVIERIQSEKLIVVADMTKFTLLIFFVSHIIGCIWYGISDKGPDGVGWVIQHDYQEAGIGLQYAISLHWSLAQFAGGMDEVTPENLTERIYAIGVFLTAFMISAVFVSALTSSMTQLHIIGSRSAEQFSVLRRYLSENRISNLLAVRVVRNARHAMMERQRFTSEDSVSLLAMLSDHLRSGLHFEIYTPLLSLHPFFACYNERHPQAMRKVCHAAAVMVMASRGDVIFHEGEISPIPKFYIIVSGTLQYSTMDHGDVATVADKEWFSEASLWTEWMHRGTMTATNDCRFCVVRAQHFQDAATQFHTSNLEPKHYAAAFVSAMNCAHRDMISDLPTRLYRNNSNKGPTWMTEKPADVEEHNFNGEWITPLPEERCAAPRP